MLIVSGLVKDGDCVMVKENPGIQSPVLLPEKKAENRAWEPIEKKESERGNEEKAEVL